MIDIHYFANVRESLGLAHEQIAANTEITTVLSLINALIARHGERWDLVLRQSKVLMAVNHTIARADTAVKDGDEVAFLPPVSGG